MNCSIVKKLLPSFIKNELDEKYNFQIRSHFVHCENCLKKKLYIELLISKLTSLNEDVPPDLKNRLISIICNSRYNRISFSVLKYASAFLVSAVLLFNMFYFTNLFPNANKNAHLLVGNVNRLVFTAEGLIEKLKASKDLLLFNSFQKNKLHSKSMNYMIKTDRITVKEI